MRYIDDLIHWREQFRQQGIALNDLPKLPDTLYIGGLDLAERVDHTAFTILMWDGTNLKQYGQSVWPHIKYKEILEDLREISLKLAIQTIGFDETGGGIPIGEFFGEYLPMDPVQLSQQKKLDCLRVVQFLSQNKILQIEENSRLEAELLEQEKIITDAGNITYKHPQGRHDDLFWSMALACYVAVPYIVGCAPAAIEVAGDYPEDVDNTITEAMHRYMYPWRFR
ncbi:MAG: hypothetical protein ACRD91_05385 [Nitrosopumilaceae archaeon]